MDFKKQQITVKTNCKKGTKTIEASVHNFLAYHKNIYKKSYISITHVPTGRHITDFKKVVHAKQLIDDIDNELNSELLDTTNIQSLAKVLLFTIDLANEIRNN